ncbi:MAG: UDP-N-acetylmuramoyl-L-alanine--D-glutamate ligase [Janthinobacterium lividum]
MSAPLPFPPALFAGRRFAVLGLGRNGLPAARALRAMGAAVGVWDDGEAARDAAAAEGMDVRRPDFAGQAVDALVASPGIPHALPAPHPVATEAIAAGVPVLSDAELLFRAVRGAGSLARFVGITGTNGKSTTTALLAHILAALGVPVAAGGNLGPAALALPLLPDGGVYVLEMSSYMLERLDTLRFDAAALLNLSPDHLDRHGDMAGYVAAKRHVFDRQDGTALAVVGVDDPDSAALAAAMPGCVRISGQANAADVFARDGRLVDAGGARGLRLAEAPALPGAHNAQNVAAAVAMATWLAADLGLPDSAAAIDAAVRSFAGLPHRQQLIAERGGIAFVDDSKATNADAAARALGCYPRLVWIAGGVAKAGGIEALAPWFPAVAHALLIGRDAPELAATLAGAGVSHEVAGTLEVAVPRAARAAAALGAEVVLLSPACASFDQFSGFEARGLRFAELARALPDCGGGRAGSAHEDAA